MKDLVINIHNHHLNIMLKLIKCMYNKVMIIYSKDMMKLLN